MIVVGLILIGLAAVMARLLWAGLTAMPMQVPPVCPCLGSARDRRCPRGSGPPELALNCRSEARLPSAVYPAVAIPGLIECVSNSCCLRPRLHLHLEGGVPCRSGVVGRPRGLTNCEREGVASAIRARRGDHKVVLVSAPHLVASPPPPGGCQLPEVRSKPEVPPEDHCVLNVKPGCPQLDQNHTPSSGIEFSSGNAGGPRTTTAGSWPRRLPW